jgi:exodeoxyribonuclease VII small subunit
MVTPGGGATMDNAAQAQSPTGAAPAFEDVLARLNTVVEKLETGELPLEASLALFEEGVRLSRQASARLDEAERRVERLLGEHDTRTDRVGDNDSRTDRVGDERPRTGRLEGDKETEST